MRIIEPHVHVWTLDTARYPWAPGTASPPTESATAEELIETLDANGVEGAVLVQVIYYGLDNSYAADALRCYPDRLAGVCLVDPQDPAAPRKLEREVRERGFSGLRLRPSHDRASTWLSDPATFPLWEKAAELGITLSILAHIEQLRMLPAPVERFPSVPVIIDHMAWPPVDEGPDGEAIRHLIRLEKYPSVHVKITDSWAISQDEEYPYRRAEPLFRRAFETFGPERCIWGSDWPLVRRHGGYGRALRLYTEEWDWLTDSDREWILCRTVEKLYPRPFAARAALQLIPMLSADPTSVSTGDLASFTRQLGAMLDAGVDVLRALRIASQHTRNTRLIAVAREVGRHLEDGQELHQAVARYPDLFDPFYAEMARQGEADGLLGRALLGVADYLDSQEGPDAAREEAPPVVPGTAEGAPGATAATLGTLGILALGAAGIWAFAAARPRWARWAPPLGLAWAGTCLLGGAARLEREGAVSGATGPSLPAPPARSRERRAAETEGIVRSALDELAEDEERRAAQAFMTGALPFEPDGGSPDQAPPS